MADLTYFKLELDQDQVRIKPNGTLDPLHTFFPVHFVPCWVSDKMFELFYKYNFTGASFTLAVDCQKGYFFHVYFDWKKNYVNYEYHIVFIGSL